MVRDPDGEEAENVRAMGIEAPGEPTQLRWLEVPDPAPGTGQALVRLRAAGVNFVDVSQRRGPGLPPGGLPAILGREGAGEVVALGDGAARFVNLGDRVAFAPIQGAYAPLIAVPADKLIPVPAAVDDVTAAAVPLQGMTAHYLVHSTHAVRSGETVLIHAAAGGVGQLLIQLCKRAGATVIGTVSSPAKAALARAAGADEVVDYLTEDFAEAARRLTGGRGVDVVYDSVGRTTIPGSFAAVRVRGHVVSYGAASGPFGPLDPNLLANGSKTLSSATLANYTLTRDELLWRAGDLFGWLADGSLRLRIEHVLSLGEAPAAHRLLEGRLTTGKIILRIGE